MILDYRVVYAVPDRSPRFPSGGWVASVGLHTYQSGGRARMKWLAVVRATLHTALLCCGGWHVSQQFWSCNANHYDELPWWLRLYLRVESMVSGE